MGDVNDRVLSLTQALLDTVVLSREGNGVVFQALVGTLAAVIGRFDNASLRASLITSATAQLPLGVAAYREDAAAVERPDA